MNGAVRGWEAAALRGAVALLPGDFRRRFGPAAVETAMDGLVDRRGPGRLLFLARSVAGLLGVALLERLSPTVPAGQAVWGRSPGRGGIVDATVQELRHAARSLARRPGYAALVMGTLALGIGATTAAFSVVDGVLLRPLPHSDPDELVLVWAHDRRAEPARGAMSLPDVESVRGLASVQAAEGLSDGTFTLTGAGDPERIVGARATGSLLAVLEGGTPFLGRDLRHDDNHPGAARVVVVSHGFWLDRLGGIPEALGTSLELDGASHEVVGVMPPGFDYPDGAAVWVAHRTDPEGCGRGCHVFQAVVRMASGVTPDRFREEARALSASLAAEFPDTNRFKAFHVESLADYGVGDVRRGLWLLFGAVAGVLLIACANVANLVLVRSASRSTEVAVRSALGAGPRRMLGSILAESAVLAGVGGALGVTLAHAAVGLLRRVPPDMVPRMEGIAVDARVMAFAVALTAGVTLLFGLAPAVGLARRPMGRTLGGAARSGERREARSRSCLLATEVGLSVVLLAGAGLFLRSLGELHGVDLGFDETEVVRFDLELPAARYAELGLIAGFYRRLEERLRAVPGVEAVGSSWDPPLGSGRIYGSIRVAGRPEPEPGQGTSASLRPVTPGFFEVLGLRLLRGRGIEALDVEDSDAVAVVNESFVRENFPGEDPLGQRFTASANFGWRPADGFRIVGVVGDVRRTPTQDPAPAAYLSHAQFGPESLTVHVRGSAGAQGIATAAREIVGQLDPDVPVASVETLDQALDRATGTTRFYLALVAGFAGLAVVLTGVGLFGVVSYLVSRRTREIGVRVALGAGVSRVRGMVVAQGLVPALWGMGLGLVVTVVGGRFLESLFFAVRAHDVRVLAGVVTLLLGLTVLATLLPARRATRVDPVQALRAE